MTPGAAAPTRATLAQRLAAFVAERYPFAIQPAAEALAAAAGDTAEATGAIRARFAEELRSRLPAPADRSLETTPGVTAARRCAAAADEIVEACDGVLRRAALVASLTPDERREILRGMVVTRATDNRLKAFFTSGEVKYGEATFQGKGFRSLGQEAIYAAGIRLRRGARFRESGTWRGDVIAPLIRDLGLVLAMRPEPTTVRMALSAQMAKAGPPMDGKDLHLGD